MLYNPSQLFLWKGWPLARATPESSGCAYGSLLSVPMTTYTWYVCRPVLIFWRSFCIYFLINRLALCRRSFFPLHQISKTKQKLTQGSARTMLIQSSCHRPWIIKECEIKARRMHSHRPRERWSCRRRFVVAAPLVASFIRNQDAGFANCRAACIIEFPPPLFAFD